MSATDPGPVAGQAATARRLVVLRHAKAAWPDLPDMARPLAPRGVRDAPEVGRWLAAAGYLPDLVVCSVARRTRQTWALLAPELRPRPASGDPGGPGGEEPPVRYSDQVYAAGTAALLDVVQSTPDDVRTLLLIGHNPGVQALTVTLTGSAVGDLRDRVVAKFPTAAVAVLTFAKPWQALRAGDARLVDLAVPPG